ncbi:phosphotransferase system lactose/cellobiose-specific iia subunit [Lucifera butyrica]|uniref:Phosphotransferase system lactose/cellobiose-specific iia subunit n=1 Tax=Lucifera butyrica TaxID=1351585 RepID=A0A498RAT3_9FIRM|nr:PTS lactose/cellobiose transporter subunit IIA [Lucifera butyrica]VBB07233.1 phosphotransferase system lactose/cellobiose-specific iia subunit [Lucifera butyrica]
MDDRVTTAAMGMILQAGDARLLISEALTAISVNDYETATEKLKEAQKKMTEAHKIQTDMIQSEARGEDIGHSLLFTHAQDTLMTVYSELNLTKKLYKVFESLEQRISKLEQGEQ